MNDSKFLQSTERPFNAFTLAQGLREQVEETKQIYQR